jgi:hypothetical protein
MSTIVSLNCRETQLIVTTIEARIRNLESFAMSAEMTGSHAFARQHREEANELKLLVRATKDRGLSFGGSHGAEVFV